MCTACIFEHSQRNLVAICHLRLLSDSDDDPIDPTVNDDQAPGDWDAQAVRAPPQASLSGRQADMCKTI
jgi:hypothetical protein